MLMLDENLARVETTLDVETMRLTVRQGNQQVASAQLTDRDRSCEDREILLAIAADLPRAAGAGALARRAFHGQAGQRHLADQSRDGAQPRSSNGAWTIDPLRFRANIYIDGAKPWEEFDWVGSEIRIGGTVFAVDRKNGRCGATNVNPATGRRDLDIPSSLRAAFGHKNLGVYLIVRDGGQIAVGDSVFVPRVGTGGAARVHVSGAADEPCAAALHLPRLLLHLRGGQRPAATIDQAGNAVCRYSGELALSRLRNGKNARSGPTSRRPRRAERE